MSSVRVTVFVGLAAAALTAMGTASANAETNYGQEAKKACEQAGLEYTESINLPGGVSAKATCHQAGQDEVKFVPMPKDTDCSVPGIMSPKAGKADGEGNCVTS
ncbi:hypothetical protein DFR70_1345 [Nocardia tenerifensis]|uniref:Subtilisin inhibitor-like n=1 Tax=Nocardia tenerifensis TaxID=228006 RepID=A0A318JMZ3_9NOCA|nr:hypothetical protein [Nocardia tenerifensis]PXX52227.1 hypothetical protein DFR70_1345 [Nocardia tenerifensis]